jgi:hypothetical protein
LTSPFAGIAGRKLKKMLKNARTAKMKKETETINKAENKEIKIWWWNFGSKTTDHKGTYAEYLKKKNIKISQVKHPTTKSTGYRAKIFVGSAIITYDDFSYDYPKLTNELQFEQGYTRFLDNAIVLFLTYLGDKTKFESPNKDYQINWRG